MDTSRFLVAPFVLLLIAGFTAAATLAETINGSSLDCTNDFDERMFCQFQAQHCAQYTLKLRSNTWHNEKWGRFQPCGTGQGCCCSVIVGEDMIIMGDTLTATVRNDAGVVESKQVPITGSVKPKAPTIVSLKQSNGNFKVFWNSNTKSNVFDQKLSGSVTYYKKGSTEKVTKRIDLSIVNGSKFYEIPGRDLEPSTTYMVSVRSYANESGRYSDSSQEWEFTTAGSSVVLHLGVTVALSAAAVLIISAALGCYYGIRAKWLDAVTKCPKPKLPDMSPGMEKGKLVCNVLKPLPADFSPVAVAAASPNSNAWSDGAGPERSPEETAGASALGCAAIKAGGRDAPSEAFAPIRPLEAEDVPRLPGGGVASNPVRAVFSNMTYFSGFPSRHRALRPGSAEAQALCDSTATGFIITDMSYQSHAKDDGLTVIRCDPA